MNKFFLKSLITVSICLFFVFSVSPVSAAGCEKKDSSSPIQSYLNPLLSFVEKTVKSLGYDVVLAADPDPDYCGSDSVDCSSGVVTVSWPAASDGAVFDNDGNQITVHPSYYFNLWTEAGVNIIHIERVNDTSFKIPSSYNLAEDSTYKWEVWGFFDNPSLGDNFFYNQPKGSFTISCNQPPAAPTVTGPFIPFGTGMEPVLPPPYLINTLYLFKAKSIDPDGDRVRMSFDWNSDGDTDLDWPADPHWANSGQDVGGATQWDNVEPNPKTFQVQAMDENGAKSGWTSHSITLTDPACTYSNYSCTNPCIDESNCGKTIAGECLATNSCTGSSDNLPTSECGGCSSTCGPCPSDPGDPSDPGNDEQYWREVAP